MRFHSFILTCVALLTLSSVVVRSGEVAVVEEPVVTAASPFEPFERGRWEAGLTAGFLHSFESSSGRTALSYLQQDLTLGLMLSTPRGEGLFRGNVEALLNLAGGEIVNGPGSYFVGGRLLFRYNFVQPEARWVPFIQIGAGGVASDAYRDQRQRILGRAASFTLVGDIGVRYFFNPRWALVLMLDYEHISNADSADRNLGVNAVGGMIGISTFF